MSDFGATASRSAAALRDRRDDPHFILGTSMADVGLGTPPENISVLRDTAQAAARETSM